MFRRLILISIILIVFFNYGAALTPTQDRLFNQIDRAFNDLGIPSGSPRLNVEGYSTSKGFRPPTSSERVKGVRIPKPDVDSEDEDYYSRESRTENTIEVSTLPPTRATFASFSPRVVPEEYTPDDSSLPSVSVRNESSVFNPGDNAPQIPGFRIMNPAQGRIYSGFGYRRNPFNGRQDFHPGIDISGPGINGAPIYAAESGTVLKAVPTGDFYGYGRYVEIRHNEIYTTRYGHCSVVYVRTGQSVRRGQLIARVGNTGASVGPHLHFEVRLNNKPVNPVNYIVRN